MAKRERTLSVRSESAQRLLIRHSVEGLQQVWVFLYFFPVLTRSYIPYTRSHGWWFPFMAGLRELDLQIVK